MNKAQGSCITILQPNIKRLIPHVAWKNDKHNTVFYS